MLPSWPFPLKTVLSIFKGKFYFQEINLKNIENIFEILTVAKHVKIQKNNMIYLK